VHIVTLSSPDICLRPERPGEVHPIRLVHEAAFKGTGEADLVDSVRATGAVALSAVVLLETTRIGGTELPTTELTRLYAGETYGGELVGHVLFTHAMVTTDKGEIPLLALGPVSVLPAEQRKGIGTMMISGCLEHLRSRGHLGVVTAGELQFFRRFGFIEAERWGLGNDLGGPGEGFLALELTPGALAGVSGVVRYRPVLGTAPIEVRDKSQGADES
jgi:predicted N-acetyltransferase YhbS